MELTTNDFRRDEKSKKQYNLKLNRSKQNIRPVAENSIHGNTERNPSVEPKSREDIVPEMEDSQNFMLRLSNSFSIDEEVDQGRSVKTALKVSESKITEVILISDSSDDASPDKCLESCRGSSKNVGSRPRSVYLIKSSDSEDSEDKRQGLTKAGIAAERLPAGEPLICSILYTSDEPESEIESMSFVNKKNISKSQDEVPVEKNLSENSDKMSENECTSIGNKKNISRPPDDGFGSEIFFENSSTRFADKENVSTLNGNINKKGDNESASIAIKKKISRPLQEIPASKKFLENESKSLAKKKDIPKSQNEFSASEMIFGKVDNPVGKTDRPRGILTENSCNIATPEIQKKITEDIKKSVEPRRTPISAKSSNRVGLLSKKDTRNILKTIKSTRLVYESPASWKKSSRVSDSSDSDDSELSSRAKKRIENENIAQRNAVIIAETDSDSDENIVRDSSKPSKTHVSRFLDPGASDEAALSEKKKLEVAHWLLTNSLDSKSDTSISNVSASQKNSPTSGNSSLERLEMNYETPNNRGKLQTLKNREKFETPKDDPRLMRTPEIGARTTFVPISAPKTVKAVRQTTIDCFVKTTRDGTRKILGSNGAVGKRNDLVSPAVKEATDALGLMDCADILDKLYGETWRAKADDLIPSTEPRKTKVASKDKAVQTERKINPRSKKAVSKSSTSSSTLDDFDKFMKDIRPKLNTTKKPVSKTNRRRCSFIRDSSSSSDNGESSYMTALTTPRISDNRKMIERQTPISAVLQRVKAICDSDSEDERSGKKQPINYRKRLSYSDDDSNTSTSEYDPSDIIPPKLTTKPSIVPAKVTKPPVSAQQKRIDKSRTFLESLSTRIPLAEAHPDAKKYRKNFKNTREDLCKYLYKMYNEKIFENKLPSDMEIEWNVRMRGTAGFCYNKRSVKALGGVTRSSRLVLATKILDTPDRLRDTLVHEMCHAAAWLINEVSDGHGPFWKCWASKAMKAFPELPAIRRCHDYDIKTKFTYRCVGCGYSIGRHSKSLDVEKKRCGHCYGKFELLINKMTKTGTVELKTPTTKKPTAFALFVKENYHSVKKDRKGVAHKEVMQILGQQFSAIKISKKNGNFDDDNSDGVSKV